MTDIFINFLARISTVNSIYKTFTRTSLNDKFTNKSYQQILEMSFGVEGCTTLTITENQVLSLGARALFLKMAIFTSQKECYEFLDYIYTAIVKKTPGFYWELLTAIKTINDHVHDTPHRFTIDNYEYQNIPCNSLLFKNIGDSTIDILSIDLIRPAIWTLIMEQVQNLKRTSENSAATGQSYREEQLLMVKKLDKLAPTSSWRLCISNITIDQINQSDRTTRLTYNYCQVLRSVALYKALLKHETYCGCEIGAYQLKCKHNANSDAKLQQKELDFLREDQLRYQQELNTQHITRPSMSF